MSSMRLNDNTKIKDNINKLSIITWNVWFDSLEQNHRYNSILSICKSLNPDIICFQEVTLPFISKLIEHKMNDDYTISDPLDGSTIHPYGILTLCKHRFNPKFKFINLKTNMNRKLLITEFQLPNTSKIKSVNAVGTIHLESLNNHFIREQQLHVCYNELNIYDFSILCGDFNFCSYRNYILDQKILENISLSNIMIDYVDTWLSLHNPNLSDNDKGYTYDTITNGMISRNKIERMRYDRICYKVTTIPSINFVPTSIELIGTDAIQLSSTCSSITNNSSTMIMSTPCIEQSNTTINISSSEDITISSPELVGPPQAVSRFHPDITTTIEGMRQQLHQEKQQLSNHATIVDSSGMITPVKGNDPTMKVQKHGELYPVTLYPSDHFGIYCIFDIIQ